MIYLSNNTGFNTGLMDLPKDIIYYIGSFINIRDKFMLSISSKYYKQLFSEEYNKINNLKPFITKIIELRKIKKNCIIEINNIWQIIEQIILFDPSKLEILNNLIDYLIIHSLAQYEPNNISFSEYIYIKNNIRIGSIIKNFFSTSIYIHPLNENINLYKIIRNISLLLGIDIELLINNTINFYYFTPGNQILICLESNNGYRSLMKHLSKDEVKNIAMIYYYIVLYDSLINKSS